MDGTHHFFFHKTDGNFSKSSHYSHLRGPMPKILIVVGIIFVSLVGLLTYSIMEPKKNTNFENTKRFAKDM